MVCLTLLACSLLKLPQYLQRGHSQKIGKISCILNSGSQKLIACVWQARKESPIIRVDAYQARLPRPSEYLERQAGRVSGLCHALRVKGMEKERERERAWAI